MKFKNTVIILTGVLALTAVAPLAATAAPVTGIKVSKDHGGIVIQQTGQEVHEVLGGTSPTMDLTVDKGYGHVKIKVRNQGTSTISWSLQGNGKEYVYKTVGKGGSLTWNSLNSFPNGMPSGKYVIQFRADGNKVDGEAWATTGQYPSDIN
ncbi:MULTISPECIES: hypothetical protein [Paenibacillus]|jgi:hypothetical protein|uniref:Pxo1-15 n=2 Tax=Paenibacillus TaxID=44249 RepID=A0ABX2Z9T2_PAEPO|nr:MULTISPECIES: hypothetical protein [Paenibacillus]APB77682.1 hypothetical protein PPYC2_23225 [Paenibacillus polymyxa]APQ57893.1 hypothetical protein VK72_03535 [Paenibacillus polymyxa]MCP3747882.1 hypothetical protein [Paenibacillus sp. A3M_27_13]MDR6781031.1 hypothetical protein [Paenibacillus peoriae]ODA07563.1 hypothetical protein A7312_10830 [Paenibacillus polymyxa]